MILLVKKVVMHFLQKFNFSILLYEIQHFVSLGASFCVDQSQSDWVGSDFPHQPQLLMSVHFEKNFASRGPPYCREASRLVGHATSAFSATSGLVLRCFLSFLFSAKFVQQLFWQLSNEWQGPDRPVSLCSCLGLLTLCSQVTILVLGGGFALMTQSKYTSTP